MRRVTSISTPVAHLVGPGKLKVINGRLAFATPEQTPVRLDPDGLRAVYCYGPVGVTDDAVTLLLEREVEVAWLTMAGTRCRGRLVRADPSRTSLRLLQYGALLHAEEQCVWARAMVVAKIDSQLRAARHYQRHGSGVEAGDLQQLQAARDACATATLAQLRGLEGTASATWFGVLGRLLLPPWRFAQRNRRPPRDPVNALLSLGYTWLLARTVARCTAAGLEVYLGGLHEYRPGRPSLACDVMEPLRVPAVDRWVVLLCNQNRVTPDDFLATEDGVRLQPGSFGRILQFWEEHWHGQQQEAALDSWLEPLLSWFRQGGAEARLRQAPSGDAL